MGISVRTRISVRSGCVSEGVACIDAARRGSTTAPRPPAAASNISTNHSTRDTVENVVLRELYLLYISQICVPTLQLQTYNLNERFVSVILLRSYLSYPVNHIPRYVYNIRCKSPSNGIRSVNTRKAFVSCRPFNRSRNSRTRNRNG